MPVQHLKPSMLTQKYRNAFCFECGKKAADTADAAPWTIWTPTMYYCPACAKQEGIGPHDF